jgi:hypothetical protein
MRSAACPTWIPVPPLPISVAPMSKNAGAFFSSSDERCAQAITA